MRLQPILSIPPIQPILLSPIFECVPLLTIRFPSCAQRICNRICIARLYGGGPPLYTCPSLILTLSEPPTTAYTHPSAPKASVPHPATPRFLLSLLSTAIYLSIPSIVSKALQRILASVGPCTVVRYLNYAIGRGIGAEDEGPGADPHVAVGLEHVGKNLSPQVDDAQSLSHSLHAFSYATSRTALDYTHMPAAELELEAKRGEVHLREYTDDDGAASGRPAYLYGAIGNRIGEAATCFLARWGVDLFATEEGGLPSAPAFAAASPRAGRRLLLLVINIHTNTTTGGAYARPHQASVVDASHIWTRGLSARWVSGLISSDAFFVQGELKRYEFARRVLELRRNLNGVIREEERGWRKLFEEGIYYSNLVSRFLPTISDYTSCSHGTTSNESRKTARRPLRNHTPPCGCCR